MIAKYLVPAVAVIGSAAASSSSASACSSATATVNSAADATALSSCSTYSGSILVSTAAAGEIAFSGIQSINGDLIFENNGAVTSLSSDSITSISGSFTLNNLTALSNLAFTQLESVGQISWTTLNALSTLNFGDVGITSAKSVVISDTFLGSLDGIDLQTVDSMNINNNHRLTEWNSKLNNLTDLLNINANGQDFSISLPNLAWIANMTISNVSTFDLPALKVVNGSARFDSNYFTSFAAPNLTETTSGDLSFVSNGDLKNISVPALTQVGGGLLIANNTELGSISFPVLKSVYGAVKLMGNFSTIDFPDLNDVRGAFDVSSTTNIDNSCNALQKLSNKGGNGDIQGTFTCSSNNSNANSDTSSNTSDTSGGSSGTGSGSGSGKNAAAGVVVNAAVLGLGVVGGMVALL